MRLLGRYRGPFGQIDIIEKKADGIRLYIEDGVYQSQASRAGAQPFQYVQLMAGILRRATDILLLGCGGGTLATALFRAGKTVTVIDRNPVSFQLAQRFFGMPEGIACVVSDFCDYLSGCDHSFDGIAIDVSGPGFSLSNAFDPATCALVRTRLGDGGRITMNTHAASDVDRTPDRIANLLAGDGLHAWIFDHPGQGERNAIIACRPERSFHARNLLAKPAEPGERAWTCRRARTHLADSRPRGSACASSY